MKMPVMAAAGLAVGLLGGAVFSGLGVKSEIMAEREQAHADSLAALDHAEAGGETESVTVELPDETVDTAAASAHPAETPPAQTTTAPDEAAHTETGQPLDSVQPEGPPAPESLQPQNPGALPTEDVGPPATEAPEGPPAAGNAAVSDEGSRRLAKIFEAMDPEDAAAVLQEMTDEEATVILVRMSDRKAAPVIASFPPERAAILGQAVLRTGPGGA